MDCTHSSAMTLTYDKETWFKVTVHSLHEDSLLVESEQMLGKGERKYAPGMDFKEIFYDLHL